MHGRHLRAAERSTSERQRLDMLTEHVMDVWLWTLAQVSAVAPSQHPISLLRSTAALQSLVAHAHVPCRLFSTGATICDG